MLEQAQLRELAKLGAERRLKQLDNEIAERRALADAIRKEFGFGRNGGEPEDEPEEGMSREELRGEIQRVLAATGGAAMDTIDIVKVIELKKKIGNRPAFRVARMCGKMPSVRRAPDDHGWLWN